MIISIDVVKAFDKITNFHGKNTQQTRNRMDLPQPDRALNKTPELIYSVAKDSLPRVREKTRMSSFYISI